MNMNCRQDWLLNRSGLITLLVKLLKLARRVARGEKVAWDSELEKVE